MNTQAPKTPSKISSPAPKPPAYGRNPLRNYRYASSPKTDSDPKSDAFVLEERSWMGSKKILMLVHAPQSRAGHLNWVALRDWVRRELPGAVVEMSALSELTFVVGNEECRIYDSGQGYDVADFDLIVFRTLYGELEAAISVAAYCRKKGIPYIDQYIPDVGNTKISCTFTRWENALPAPTTVYGSAAHMEAVAAEGGLGWPLIVKADKGKKGNHNYLAQTLTEVKHILADATKRYVIQSYVPNEGDYRILVFGNKPRMAIWRSANGKSHLNNTSKGGTATEVPMDRLPPNIKEIAAKAAEVERLAIAGVDIIVDKGTGESYVLEVNRAPQIATGAFANKKMRCYTQALQEIVSDGALK